MDYEKIKVLPEEEFDVYVPELDTTVKATSSDSAYSLDQKAQNQIRQESIGTNKLPEFDDVSKALADVESRNMRDSFGDYALTFLSGFYKGPAQLGVGAVGTLENIMAGKDVLFSQAAKYIDKWATGEAYLFADAFGLDKSSLEQRVKMLEDEDFSKELLRVQSERMKQASDWSEEMSNKVGLPSGTVRDIITGSGSVGVSVGTSVFSPLLTLASFGIGAGGENLVKRREAGQPEGQAFASSLMDVPIIGWLNTIGDRAILGGMLQKTLSKVGLAAEGVKVVGKTAKKSLAKKGLSLAKRAADLYKGEFKEEGGEALYTDTMLKLEGVEDKSWGDIAVDAIVQGNIGGLSAILTGGAIDVSLAITQPSVKSLTKDLESKGLDHNTAETMAKQIVDETTPEKVKQNLLEVLNEDLDPIKYKNGSIQEDVTAATDSLVVGIEDTIKRNELVDMGGELIGDKTEGMPALYQLGEVQVDTTQNPNLGMVLYQAEQAGKPFQTLGQVLEWTKGKLDLEQAQKMSTGISSVYSKTYEALKNIGFDDVQADANARLRSAKAFAIARNYGMSVEEADNMLGGIVSQRASEFQGRAAAQYQDVAQRINEIDAEEQAKGVPEYTAPTININGVERQTTNSDGNPIAKSEKSLRYFYNWFGDSKVVDERGRPLVVYHGSKANNIEVFYVGLGTNGLAYGSGVYFSRKKILAESNYGKNVYNVYLREQNPFFNNSSNSKEMEKLFNAVGEEYKDGDTISKITNKNEEQTYKAKEITKALKSMGYDGVIFGYNNNPAKGIEYVAFNPNQIKSASNRGTYSLTEDNIYYQFVGENARTAALDKLEQAKRMDNKKANTEDIRKKTGWFKGKDGKWRFEISDKEAKFKPDELLKFKRYTDKKGNKIYETTLGELIEHEKLFEAYPELKDVVVIITEEEQTGDYVKGGEIVDGKIKLYSDAINNRTQGKKTLMHEMQHLIQGIEGFARGGSPADYTNALLGLQEKIDSYKKQLINEALSKKFGKTFDGFSASWIYGDAFLNKPLGDWFYKKEGLNRSEVISELNKQKEEIVGKYENFAKETKDNFKYKTSTQYYKSIYGEIEARNTAERMNLDEQDRLNKSIESTQDIPTEDAIVIFDDGTMASYEPQKFYQDESNPRGAYYNNTIYLFEKADESTFVHEMSHAYMDVVERLAQGGNAQAQRDLNAIRKWLGKKQGEAFTQADWERFARGFEMYMREGKSPNEYLGGTGGVFDKFKNWLMNIYAGIRNLTVTNEKGKQEPVKINQQIKQFYDEMLGGQDIDKVLDTAEKNQQAMVTLQNKLDQLADAQRVLAEERARLVREMANNVKPDTNWSNVKDWGKNVWESAKELPSNVLQSSYERLSKIDQRLGLLVQRVEQSQGLRLKKWADEIQPFYEAFNNLSAEDKAKVQFYLLNQQWGDVEDIIGKDSTEAVQKMLKEVYEELVASGVEVGYRDNYFPRAVLDYDGLLQEMGLSYPALRKEMEEAIGKDATPEQQAEWLDKHIMGFKGNVSLNQNRNTKERKLDLITDTMAKYYKPSMETLVDYMNGMAKLLSMREAFGRDIEYKESTAEDSIGKIINNLLTNEKLTKKEIDEVRQVLSALYLPNGMGNKFLQAMRQYGYATKLSYSTTVRQFADIGMMMKVNGVLNTLDALFHPDKRITLETLGIDPLGEEFQTSKKDVGGKIANIATKWKGINWADAVMKNAFMRGNYKSLQELAKTPDKFHQKYDALFGDETDTLIKDLNANKLSEPVKVLLFHEISKIQPISRSAMPTAYLSNPNGRVFYMFKTFSLHRAEYMVSELAEDFRRGDLKKAGKDIMADVAVIGWEGLVELLIAFLKYGWQAFALNEVLDTFMGSGLGVLGLNKHQALQITRGQIGDFFQQMVGVGTPFDDIGYMIRHYDDDDKLLRAFLPDMILEPLIAGPKPISNKKKKATW